MEPLEIYVLNVGQADTSIIRTPLNNIIVIDAVQPTKIRNVLDEFQSECKISHLIVTHPHLDHYAAVQSLLEHYHVQMVTLSPFWHMREEKAGYHAIINSLLAKNIRVDFLSGYKRNYPDGGEYKDLNSPPCLELLGPPNDILKELYDSDVFNPNHLSIIARLTYGEFSMVFAADAQMENWAHYDREGMLEEKCSVLKASHHGSKRGTQWERLERLSPGYVIVSSDPRGQHNLPDLIGSTTFLEYAWEPDREVALTSETGTIRIAVFEPASCDYEMSCYREGPEDTIFPGTERVLPQTDWSAIVKDRISKRAPKATVQDDGMLGVKSDEPTDKKAHLAELEAKGAVRGTM
jgi:competence protein ComEC